MSTPQSGSLGQFFLFFIFHNIVFSNSKTAPVITFPKQSELEICFTTLPQTENYKAPHRSRLLQAVLRDFPAR